MFLTISSPNHCSFAMRGVYIPGRKQVHILYVFMHSPPSKYVYVVHNEHLRPSLMLTVSMGFSLPLVINSPLPISPFVGLANGNDLVVKSSLTVVSVGSNSLPNHVCFDLLSSSIFFFCSFLPSHVCNTHVTPMSHP